jgi:undecaprenyl-diphosphatase
MDLIQQLNFYDTQLLLFLNSLHNSFFDGFMYTFTQTYVWIPFYLSVIYVILKSQKKEAAFWVILSLILCVVIADQVSSGFIKNAVQRLRPSRDPALEGLIHGVNAYVGGKFGFTSAHAANTFSFALLSAIYFRNKNFSIAVIFWSLMNCYTRMYLGVHYPLDIVGGLLVGFLTVLVIYALMNKLKPALIQNDLELPAAIPLYTLAITLIGIIGYSVVIV